MNISSLLNPTAVTPSPNSLPRNLLHSQPQEAKTSPSTIEGHENARDKHQAALQLVNRTLTMAYEKISTRGQTAAKQTATATATAKDNYDAFEPLTATKVANNILGFIERRLQMDVADGASQEQLQSRLDAGLTGFKKGFAEANETLKALNMLSPEIAADVNKTYDLVIKGVDDLRPTFITATEIPADKVTLKSTPSTKPISTLQVPDVLTNIPTTNQTYGSYEYARANEFSFELTTAEGDTVTISAKSSEGLSIVQGTASNGNNSSGFYSASASSNKSLAWSVEGDLNENEINAINELIGRVDTLAEQFFSGNLDEAFNQALTLGYDETQISSYALHLAQVEIQQVTQAYNEFAPQEADSSQNRSTLLAEQLLPLGDFIKNLLAALNNASLFSEPHKLLNDVSARLMGKVEPSEMGKRFSDFVSKLFALDLSNTPDKNITDSTQQKS